MRSDIKELQQFYSGFYITQPVGNNAFSYRERAQRKIYVPSIIRGNLDDLAMGDEIAFSEVDEGVEINQKGLKHFIHMKRRGKDFFIFDNHNHAFFFWMFAFKTGRLRKGLRLVHVDQHTDMREPERYFQVDSRESTDLQAAFEYTNTVLNVGNFIQPALRAGLFSAVDIIDSSSAFEKAYSEEIVLDIDIDVFSPAMAYIDDGLKKEKIRSYIKPARLITIASSPYFMEQEAAIRVIKDLLRMFHSNFV